MKATIVPCLHCKHIFKLPVLMLVHAYSISWMQRTQRWQMCDITTKVLVKWGLYLEIYHTFCFFFTSTDIDECDKETQEYPCDIQEFCENNKGSYKCVKCDASCNRCLGKGNKMCISCKEGYKLEEGTCLGKWDKHTKNLISRYNTYNLFRFRNRWYTLLNSFATTRRSEQLMECTLLWRKAVQSGSCHIVFDL